MQDAIELVSTMLPEEEEYNKFRKATFCKLDSIYFSQVSSLLNKANKNLKTIRREILAGEQNDTLTTKEGREIEVDLESFSTDELIKKYFYSWFIHDSFSLETVSEMEQILNDKEKMVATMNKFILNDQLIRIYVSKGLPIILDRLRKEIVKSAGIDLVPVCDSFEVFLIQEAEKAVQSEEEMKEFSKKYTYSDIDIAREEIKRLYNSDMKPFYNKLKSKKEEEINKFSEILNSIKEGCDLKCLHQYLRLSHWAAFEESRKRYIIEGGIVDYLFRELTYQKMKYELKVQCLQNTSFCLELNQEKFFEILTQNA